MFLVSMVSIPTELAGSSTVVKRLASFKPDQMNLCRSASNHMVGSSDHDGSETIEDTETSTDLIWNLEVFAGPGLVPGRRLRDRSKSNWRTWPTRWMTGTSEEETRGIQSRLNDSLTPVWTGIHTRDRGGSALMSGREIWLGGSRVPGFVTMH